MDGARAYITDDHYDLSCNVEGKCRGTCIICCSLFHTAKAEIREEWVIAYSSDGTARLNGFMNFGIFLFKARVLMLIRNPNLRSEVFLQMD